MKEGQVTVGHPLGLHARAAAKLVQLAAQFQSSIALLRVGSDKAAEADARSILSILLLAAGNGSILRVRTEGVDEEEAMRSVCEYLQGQVQ
ncbi:MAG TPA: HPr family phosphocarrier protein [Tepidisphaeraceae bacterium]|jgi:phosphotransferase system HPr (HPr) family protein